MLMPSFVLIDVFAVVVIVVFTMFNGSLCRGMVRAAVIVSPGFVDVAVARRRVDRHV